MDTNARDTIALVSTIRSARARRFATPAEPPLCVPRCLCVSVATRVLCILPAVNDVACADDDGPRYTLAKNV